MWQNTMAPISDPKRSADITLLEVKQEIGLSRATLKNSLTSLGREPICFPLGTHRLSLLKEAMTLVKCIKHDRELLAQLPSLGFPLGPSEQGASGDEKDTCDGC